jgi:hypothetical protein
MEQSNELQGVNNCVLFNMSNLQQCWVTASETISVTLELAIVHLTDTTRSFCEERPFFVGTLEEFVGSGGMKGGEGE